MIDLAHVAGKYGAYVWPAYGVSLGGLIVMISDTIARARRWRQEFERRRGRSASSELDEP